MTSPGPEPQPGPVVLVGYRCTGKSSVAPRVARALGWTSVDMDDAIVCRSGKSIREIFRVEGEEGFRQREADLLAELVRQPNLVIAAGGGVVLRPENRRILRPLPVVWLRARPEVIVRRLVADARSGENRPPLTDLDLQDEIVVLLQQRTPLYEAVAKLTIDTDELPVEQVAERIVAWLRAAGADVPHSK